MLRAAAGDIEPETGGARAARPAGEGGAPGRQARSGVGHNEPCTPAGAGREPHGERRAVRGVGEHVAEQRVHTRAEVGGAQRHGQRAGRDVHRRRAVVSSASTAQNATRSRTTAAASLPARPAPGPLPRRLAGIRQPEAGSASRWRQPRQGYRPHR